ncbi:MAG TPA: antibiotic biosynthesis monooxygenase [Candidatus Tidjanibacter faecipullorum]|uniref:Antibiotic biosynthesis monooxygenase n=1 Tax=Candidatus Tidjanibacter faecipullorum TaxID=2838766 RepID=A0A9D2DET3_9BACT|nr:antibiotic biosynthesis monooxygenase [Candidatus Tidjanibacter faecipullorum]
MMITIVARNIVRDGKREAFLEAVRPLIAASRSEEGNIAYDLYEDINEANAFCFIEKWKDPEAIAAHNASSHFREWMACKAEFVISGTVARYRIL